MTNVNISNAYNTTVAAVAVVFKLKQAYNALMPIIRSNEATSSLMQLCAVMPKLPLPVACRTACI